jgi:hypothetical protein
VTNGRIWYADVDTQVSQTFDYNQDFRIYMAMAAQKISKHIEL